jgi:hypothetical protein
MWPSDRPQEDLAKIWLQRSKVEMFWAIFFRDLRRNTLNMEFFSFFLFNYCKKKYFVRVTAPLFFSLPIDQNLPHIKTMFRAFMYRESLIRRFDFSIENFPKKLRFFPVHIFF